MGTISLKLLFGFIIMFTASTSVDLTHLKHDTKDCRTMPWYLLLFEVSPIKYNIKLITMPSTRNLSGEVDIMIDVKKPTKEISLHSRGLEVSISHTKIMTLKSDRKDEIYKTKYYQMCHERNILILFFDELINSGKYILHIEYTSNYKYIDDIFYPYYDKKKK